MDYYTREEVFGRCSFAHKDCEIQHLKIVHLNCLCESGNASISCYDIMEAFCVKGSYKFSSVCLFFQVIVGIDKIFCEETKLMQKNKFTHYMVSVAM